VGHCTGDSSCTVCGTRRISGGALFQVEVKLRCQPQKTQKFNKLLLTNLS